MGRTRVYLLGTGIAVSDDLKAIEETSLWGLAVPRTIHLLCRGKETTKERGGEPPALGHDRERGVVNGATQGINRCGHPRGTG